MLRGNNPAVANGSVVRGQRVFCSDRGRRGGCGKTFPLFFAEVLPRHSFPASMLWALLRALLDGKAIRAAAETLRLPFSLEAAYGIIRRVRRRLDGVRSWLWRERAPPPSNRTDPLLQTLEHLQTLFRSNSCALTAYQRQFQQAFLG